MNRYTVRVEGRRDETLSRWLPLVKWLLLIPHYVILFGLWVAFVVLTLTAYVVILVTGRYPPPIFAFNVGVLRWSWRVNYYGYQALGTDRYPPFTLADIPDYPARIHIGQPPRPPRWLPLVAWLFAVPHLLLVAALTGAAALPFRSDGTASTASLGVVGLGLLIAALSLLFTGRYPRGLYDLLVGIARWSLRVTAYLALLTTEYPPFRLDQGDTEPGPEPDGADTTAPGVHEAHEPRGTGRRGAALPATALVAGVLLLLAGIGTGVGGGALLALNAQRDTGGYVTSPTLHLASPTAAITAESLTVQAGDLWSRNLADIGGVRITATNQTGTPLFIGIAPQPAVDAWLVGTAHDQVTTISAGEARYERSTGAARPVTAPTGQDFWLASASGNGSVVLDWQAANGNFAVVLANADGTPGATAAVRVATQVPDLAPLGTGLLSAGVVVALIAIALIILGGTGLGRRHTGSPPPDGPIPAAPAGLDASANASGPVNAQRSNPREPVSG